MFNFKAIKLIILTQILFFTNSSGADSNRITGQQYSLDANCISDTSFKNNRGILLNSLATNGPLNGGFYQTSVGKGSSKVYGLIQCRADLPAAQCSNCTDQAIKTALNLTDCPVQVWSTWCFLGYSNRSFTSQWDGPVAAVAFNSSQSNGSALILPGSYSFLRELASNASEQPQMFQVGVLDLGQKGKRYGMAQCYRVIRRSECEDCLSRQIDLLLATKRNWSSSVTVSYGCGLWYYDYQFYFNISTSATSGSRRYSLYGKSAGGVIIAVLALLYVL